MIRQITVLLFCLILLPAMPGCYQALSFKQRIQRERSFEALLSIAVRLMREGSENSLRRATAALRMAEELHPRSARVYDGLGCIAFREGNLAEARRWFVQAIEVNPFYGRAYAHLALVEERLGRMLHARALFKRALELEPLDYRSRGNYGAMLIDAGQREKGLEETEKAWSLAPQAQAVLDRLQAWKFQQSSARLPKEQNEPTQPAD
jgi:Tfp pilus assembly protein PilF